MWRTEAQALNLISSVVGLRTQNPNLKIIAAIGGANDKLIPTWSSVAANAKTRLNFANNILAFIKKTNINGVGELEKFHFRFVFHKKFLDIDWEYPNFSEDKPQDKANFVLLLQQIKKTLGAKYSLSTAIGAGEWRSGLSYDLPKIFAAVDFVNLMTYDLHGSWESKTGIHGAMYRSKLDNTPSNVHESVQFILKQGVDKNKIIMGIPAYGNAFTLLDPAKNGVGAAAKGGGSEKFNEICQKVNSNAYTSRWEDTQKVPYAFKGTYWIGYDNVKSVTEKARYIVTQKLGGAMFWSLDSDDFKGVCKSGLFPLITSVNDVFKNYKP